MSYDQYTNILYPVVFIGMGIAAWAWEAVANRFK